MFQFGWVGLVVWFGFQDGPSYELIWAGQLVWVGWANLLIDVEFVG